MVDSSRGLPGVPAHRRDAASAVRLCTSDELTEKGTARAFDVLHFRQPARGFALRFEGRVVAYLNRCLHVPMEMDWQPNEFLDSAKEYIMCATHGAFYQPQTGRCVGGPCGRGKLTAIDVEERDGVVYWYACPDTKPALLPTEAD